MTRRPPARGEPLTRMELLISHVLRAGVLLSGAVILAGTLAFAITGQTGYARVPPHGLRDLLAFHQGRRGVPQLGRRGGRPGRCRAGPTRSSRSGCSCSSRRRS